MLHDVAKCILRLNKFTHSPVLRDSRSLLFVREYIKFITHIPMSFKTLQWENLPKWHGALNCMPLQHHGNISTGLYTIHNWTVLRLQNNIQSIHSNLHILSKPMISQVPLVHLHKPIMLKRPLFNHCSRNTLMNNYVIY